MQRRHSPIPLTWAIFGAVCVAHQALSQEAVVVPMASFAKEMMGREVSFLAVDLANGKSCTLEGSDLETRHTPWSTFKIPNLLIALETGVASGLDSERLWDPLQRPSRHFWPNEWQQSQTLESAFVRSAVWYFQEVALDVGTPRYREILEKWSYGNGDAQDGPDSFWLDGTLRISVGEQVEFLSNLLTGAIDVAPSSFQALSRVAEDGAGQFTGLHGKTGAGPSFSGGYSSEGWFVGWVDRDELDPVPFALYVQANSHAQLRNFRREFAVRLLTTCGYLPDG